MTPTSKADVWSSNNIYIIFSIVANPKDKNTEYIIISSIYNLSNTGEYTIDIIGLDTSHGIIL